MDKLVHGNPAHLPFDYELLLVAARFGLDPDAVAEWPADRYSRAVQLIPVLALVGLPGGSDGR